MKDDNVAQGDFVKLRGFLHRVAGIIHEGFGLEQKHFFGTDHAFTRFALKARAPAHRVETTRDGINRHEADIMPVSGIARSGIAKTYEEQHQLIFWVAALKVIL